MNLFHPLPSEFPDCGCVTMGKMLVVMGLLVLQGESLWGLWSANAAAASSAGGVLVAKEMEGKAPGCDLCPDRKHTCGLPLCIVLSWGFAVRS